MESFHQNRGFTFLKSLGQHYSQFHMDLRARCIPHSGLLSILSSANMPLVLWQRMLVTAFFIPLELHHLIICLRVLLQVFNWSCVFWHCIVSLQTSFFQVLCNRRSLVLQLQGHCHHGCESQGFFSLPQTYVMAGATLLVRGRLHISIKVHLLIF